ncbi:MAG: BrnT family toxin [Candidatus Competibacteraceae bacterium]
MQFEWDEHKNKRNQRKHGLSFETVALVFRDPNVLSELDKRYEDIEERWYSIGRIGITVVYVSHTIVESEHGEEIIRIISARKATSSEKRRYYTQ